MTQTRRLHDHPSSYLRAHADDPVAWCSWEPDTLSRARREHQPILLSIGYVASEPCFRVHAECFTDPVVAELLNRSFVCVLVDRLDRPDLDRLYQEAFRLLYGQSGGWPLTLLLTPDDQVPFFGAIALHKMPEQGLPGCAELLDRLAAFLAGQEDQVRQQNARLLQALRAGPPRHGRTGYSLHAGPLDDAIRQLAERYAADHGGFGPPPRFPQAPLLERLLRHWRHTVDQGSPDRQAGLQVRFTLERMARGEIHAADGGFYRCARGPDWNDPDRERLLADNAVLLGLYAQAWRAFEVPLFQQLAGDLADWLIGRLQGPAGGFYAAVLEDGSGSDQQMPLSWNALTIRQLALTSRHLDRPDLLRAAERALGFVRAAPWRDGLLEDHAWLLDALLELLQCRWDATEFDWALELGERLLERFQDSGKNGGFYQTAADHEPLIARLKPIHDDILPAAGGVAARNLMRLGHLLGSLRHLLAAERALKNAWPSIEREPLRCAGMLLALEEYYFPSRTVVIRGPREAIDPWRRVCGEGYAPRRMTLAIPDEVTELPAALAACRTTGRVTAWICQRGKCSDPIAALDALQQALES